MRYSAWPAQNPKTEKMEKCTASPLGETVIFGGKLPGPVRPRAYWAGAGYEVKREVGGSGVSPLLGDFGSTLTLLGLRVLVEGSKPKTEKIKNCTAFPLARQEEVFVHVRRRPRRGRPRPKILGRIRWPAQKSHPVH